MTNLHQSSLDLVKQVLNVWIKKYNAELQKTGNLNTNVALEGNEIKVLYDNLRKYCGEELKSELGVEHPKLSSSITILDDARIINRNEGSTIVYATLHEIKKIVAYVSNLGVKGLSLSQGKIDELEELSFAMVYVEPIKQILNKWVNAFNEAYHRNKESVLIHVKDFEGFYENLTKFALETKGDVLHELNTNMYAVLEELNQDRLHAESQHQNYFIMGAKEFEKLAMFHHRFVKPTVIQAKETVSETVEELQAKVEKLKKDLEVERKEHIETKESMKAENEELYTTISELTDELVEASEKADNLAKVLGYEVFNNVQLQENGGLIGFDTETYVPFESICPTGRLKPYNPESIAKCETPVFTGHNFFSENKVIVGKPANGKNMFFPTSLKELAKQMGLTEQNKAPQELNLKEGKAENKGKDLKLKGNIVEQMKQQGLLVDIGPSFPDKFETEGKTEQQIGSDILKLYNGMKPGFKKMMNMQMFLAMLHAQTKAQEVGDGEEIATNSGFPVFVITNHESPKK
ncbi:hypothetical protein [Bacillus toyonensis]|uniref:hypothetical protein n=1 Tax=Bacillus toyonensis TaxID=155322 RepID=UPI00211D53BD|nr:hypothetical protein [Bacillus toyonensis]